MTIQVNDDTIDVCVGLNSEGSVLKIYSNPNEMHTDADPDVVSTGIITAIITEYTEFFARQPARYVICGCCEEYHRVGYAGDCRNNEERFNGDDLDEKHGIYGWEIINEEEGE